MSQSTFSGRTRQRRTRLSVRVADRVARGLISLGGLGVIIAVGFVFVFLAWVVVPLFMPGTLAPAGKAAPFGTEAAQMGVDEYQVLAWSLEPDGSLATYQLADGQPLGRIGLSPGARPTAMAVDPRLGTLAFGYADGSLRLGRMIFSPRFLTPDELTPALRALPLRGSVPWQGGVVTRTGEAQYLLQILQATMDEPVPGESPAAVLRLDQSLRGDDPVVAAYTADGVLRLYGVTRRTNLLTGKVTVGLSGGSLSIPSRPGAPPPAHVRISGVGDAVYVVWDDGHTLRVDTRDLAQPKIVETLDLIAPPEAKLTSVVFLIGKATLIVGDSTGGITAWFRVKPPGGGTEDGSVLAAGHVLPPGPAAVTALAPSARTRVLAAGFADGTVRLYHVTSNQVLAEARADPGRPIGTLAIAPKDDGLLAVNAGAAWRWGLDLPHPEATAAAIFTPIWYEGYLKPEHVWQSSSGTDDFEPKFGLVPLIFGTIKATFYSMLFGVPIALLAAVYTSEFVHPRVKARIKPTIEMMASLPSVVLGFLAALIFAPFVEAALVPLLTALFTVPFVFLLGAHLWQLLPRHHYARLVRFRLWTAPAVIPVGLALAWWTGPLVERLLFAGDIKLWLDGQTGGATGGWMLAMLPLSALAAALGVSQLWTYWYGKAAASWSRDRLAAMALVKFLLGTLATLALALALSWLLTALGWDARGAYLGTYVQRNALVVGFVMGFAVIPIIYTLSEDALSAVPEHLRAASLASGATPWQTALRIIVPTAMSGLFSAVMIGFGRAVGETMIVLMAAGNTPVMEWNIFNGFRTLSANIAVELPEAVRNSTHYRTLFLAALTLFVMTFALNTLAEMVRQRFRKRSYQL